MILDDVVLLPPSLQLLNVKRYFLWTLFKFPALVHALSVLIFTVCALVSIDILLSSFFHFSHIMTFLFLYQNNNHVHSFPQSRVNLFSL